MKLIAYPESKLEPKKIVVHKDERDSFKGDFMAQVYSDGAISINAPLVMPKDIDNIILIRDNFFLFYENIENVNNQR